MSLEVSNSPKVAESKQKQGVRTRLFCTFLLSLSRPFGGPSMRWSSCFSLTSMFALNLILSNLVVKNFFGLPSWQLPVYHSIMVCTVEASFCQAVPPGSTPSWLALYRNGQKMRFPLRRPQLSIKYWEEKNLFSSFSFGLRKKDGKHKVFFLLLRRFPSCHPCFPFWDIMDSLSLSFSLCWHKTRAKLLHGRSETTSFPIPDKTGGLTFFQP